MQQSETRPGPPPLPQPLSVDWRSVAHGACLMTHRERYTICHRARQPEERAVDKRGRMMGFAWHDDARAAGFEQRLEK
jgi:hypothetical protein